MKNVFKGANDDGSYLLVTEANTEMYDFIITIYNEKSDKSQTIRLNPSDMISLKNAIESVIPF